jgi:hypothetical protein
MAKLLSILLVGFFSLSLVVTSLHNHKGLDDHHTCSFCMHGQDFSSLEIVNKPVLIIPQAKESVFVPESRKIINTLSISTLHPRAPPALSR